MFNYYNGYYLRRNKRSLVNDKILSYVLNKNNTMLKKANNKVIEGNNEKRFHQKSNPKSKTKKWEINHIIDEHLIINRKYAN